MNQSEKRVLGLSVLSMLILLLFIVYFTTACSNTIEELPAEAEGAYVVLTKNAENVITRDIVATISVIEMDKAILMLTSTRVSELYNNSIESNSRMLSQLTDSNIALATAWAQLTEVAYSPTPTPTQEGYTNPTWRDAVVIAPELTLHRETYKLNFKGDAEIINRNNNGYMILEGVPKSDVMYRAGEHLVIVFEAIQVDGGKVYYVIWPKGAGLYVNVNHVVVIE